MDDAAEILLVSDCPDRVYRWARTLTACETRLWQGLGSMPKGLKPDVIVTDDAGWRVRVCPRADRSSSSVSLCGVVLVGADGPADVRLHSDCPDSELRLACRLLAENIRLRRACRRATRAQRVLARMAFTDPLTGLPNLRAWEDELQQRDATPAGRQRPLCLALFDLDCFKTVNDIHGHLAGDEVLRRVAGRWENSLGSPGFVARLSGDEFAILCEGEALVSVPSRLDTLRAVVCDDLPHGPITGSLGCAIRSLGDPRDARSLLRAADEALRAAKSLGRNRTVVAPSPAVRQPD